METTSLKIYIPPNTRTLDKLEKNQIRLGIQGFPGTGKTYSAVSFPYPIVLDMDKGLGAHRGRTDIIQVPLLDENYARSIYRDDPKNLKELILKWMTTEAHKLTEEQTLILDGLSGTEFAYHKFYVPVISARSGKVDEFAEWQLKVEYFNEILEETKKLKCNFILLTHEYEKPDKPTTVGQPGEYTGKIRPLITGQYCNRLVGQFTDWFRMHSMLKPDCSTLTEMQKKNIQLNWNMTPDEFATVCKEEGSKTTLYYWQLMGDDIFDAKASSLINFPKFIPASFKYFKKYMK